MSPKELADVYKQADETCSRRAARTLHRGARGYADGSYHDVVFHKATFADARGELAGLVGTLQHITSRKVA